MLHKINHLNPHKEAMEEEYPIFSFFSYPISNVIPSTDFTIIDAYNYIRDQRIKPILNEYRNLPEGKEKKQFKASKFSYVTFSGKFSKRSSDAIVNHSGYICIDLDDVNVDIVFDLLKGDKHTALLFRSPSGNGLKWIVEVNIAESSHDKYFECIKVYLADKYSLTIDPSGKDIARACFLCYDKEAFINPKLLSYV